MADDRTRMLATLEEMQVRDSLRTFNALVMRCFSDCVNDFGSKNLEEKETKCVNNCAQRFFVHAVRGAQPWASHRPF